MLLVGRSNPPAAKASQTKERCSGLLRCCFLSPALLERATVRLYMKDGTYHNVREYEKKGDRIRYYSTERSEWEEIPSTSST